MTLLRNTGRIDFDGRWWCLMRNGLRVSPVFHSYGELADWLEKSA